MSVDLYYILFCNNVRTIDFEVAISRGFETRPNRERTTAHVHDRIQISHNISVVLSPGHYYSVILLL